MNDVDILVDNGNDLIVIYPIIDNYLIERILVEDGSVDEVLIYDAFKKIGLDESLLMPIGPIYGFVNQPIKVKGLITLLVTLCQGDNIVIEQVKFLVVDKLYTYNTIIDWPLIKKTNMVTMVYFLTIKFLTSTRIKYVKAKHVTTR